MKMSQETLSSMEMTKDEERFLYKVLQSYRRGVYTMGKDGNFMGELFQRFGDVPTAAITAELGGNRNEFLSATIEAAAAAMALHLVGDVRYPGTRKNVP